LTLKIIRRIKLRKVIINKLLWIINLLNVNISEGIFYYAGNWNILVPVGKKINRDFGSSGERIQNSLYIVDALF